MWCACKWVSNLNTTSDAQVEALNKQTKKYISEMIQNFFECEGHHYIYFYWQTNMTALWLIESINHTYINLHCLLPQIIFHVYNDMFGKLKIFFLLIIDVIFVLQFLYSLIYYHLCFSYYVLIYPLVQFFFKRLLVCFFFFYMYIKYLVSTTYKASTWCQAVGWVLGI